MNLPVDVILVYVFLATGVFTFNDVALLYVVMQIFRRENGITRVSDIDSQTVPDSKLPVISILLPLYKERRTLPYLVKSILETQYPKEKLDIHFLVERDDIDTLRSILDLPAKAGQARGVEYDEFGVPVRIIVWNGVPIDVDFVYEGVRTKPNALNVGLRKARGSIVTIYDAEDRPDFRQLRKVATFMLEHPEVACVQARLAYYNPDQSLLTKFFSIEYVQHFLLMLPEFESMKALIPLGGTSNFFRAEVLRDLKGWDASNVTEDADLGIRLAKRGYLTAPIDVITWEEAPPKLYTWIRQRVRWNKGFLYTLAVHFRHPMRFVKEVGFKATFYCFLMLFYPVISAISLLGWFFFSVYWLNWLGIPIEPFASWIHQAFAFNHIILYLLVFGFIFGMLYSGTVAVEALFTQADQYALSKVKYAVFNPFYQLLHSIASIVAIFELVTKPKVWHKTPHGFSIEEEEEEDATN